MDNELIIGLLVAIPFFGVIGLWLGAEIFDKMNDRSNDGID